MRVFKFFISFTIAARSKRGISPKGGHKAYQNIERNELYYKFFVSKYKKFKIFLVVRSRSKALFKIKL